MQPVRWGVLGTARIAMERVVPAMRETTACRVDAIASRSANAAAAAARRAGAARHYGSYEALLDDPDIEAVYVPLPNHLHVEWCTKALEAGKHVLCEKPVALDATGAETLVRLRDRTGLRIEEAFAIRNHPQWRAMREVIESGEIGELCAAQATLAYRNLDPDDIRNQQHTGGGALYDIGSYAIAACRMAFQTEPLRALALIGRDEVFATDRLTTGLLEFEGGHASFTVTTQGGPSTGGTHQHFALIGTKGWIRAEFPFAHPTPRACRLFIGDAKSAGTYHAREIALPAVNQYGRQGERFSRLIRGEAVPEFPLETAVANMRVIDALFRSGESGRWECV